MQKSPLLPCAVLALLSVSAAGVQLVTEETLVMQEVNEPAKNASAGAISNAFNGSDAPTASGPELLASRAMSNVSSEAPRLGYASLAYSSTLHAEQDGGFPNATEAWPSANETWSLPLSQGALASLVLQAAQRVGGNELFYTAAIFGLCCVTALLAICSLESRPRTAAFGRHQWQRMGQFKRSAGAEAQPSGVAAGSSSDGDVRAAPRGSKFRPAGRDERGSQRQRLSSGSLSSGGERRASPRDRASLPRAPTASCPCFIHKEYVVPPTSECHLALPCLADAFTFEQLAITDPKGIVLFYFGAVREDRSRESLVLWDAARERLGSCSLAVDGRAGGQVIADAHGQKHAVVQARIRGRQGDSSQGYALHRLTPGSSWRLSCGAHFAQEPVLIHDEDDRPIARMTFEAGGHQLLIARNTDVCLVLLFVLSCERLRCDGLSDASTPTR